MIFLNYNEDLTDTTLVNKLETTSWYNLPDSWKEEALYAYSNPHGTYVFTVNSSNEMVAHKITVEQCHDCSWPASLCFCE